MRRVPVGVRSSSVTDSLGIHEVADSYSGHRDDSEFLGIGTRLIISSPNIFTVAFPARQ